jgi:hypothetical protein
VTQNPLILCFQALILLFSGRVTRCSKPGQISMELKHETFVAFRKISLKNGRHQPQVTGAIFQVRFHFKNFSPGLNRFLSLIPVPLIIAQPGFISKTWFLGRDTGDFTGYYEFSSIEAAELYWNSLALRMMRSRATAGSLEHIIIPPSID